MDMSEYDDDVFFLSAQNFWEQANEAFESHRWPDSYFYYNEAFVSLMSFVKVHENEELKDKVQPARDYLQGQLQTVRHKLLGTQPSPSPTPDDEPGVGTGTKSSKNPSGPSAPTTSGSSGLSPKSHVGNQDSPVPSSHLKEEKLSQLEKAKRELREKLVKGPIADGIKWTDIKGCDDIKRLLETKLITSRTYSNLLAQTKPNTLAKNILFYGPPGCGKSLFGKAVSTEVGGSYFPITSGDVMSKWRGVSEVRLRAVFEIARENKPCVIFIDELESLVPSREYWSSNSGGIVQEFLSQTEGADPSVSNDGITLLGATNYPWKLDGASLRRFSGKVMLGLPDEISRIEIFQYHLSTYLNLEHSLTVPELLKIGQLTEFYSGSDLSNLVSDISELLLEKCQSAEYFWKQTEHRGSKVVSRWVPCSSTTQGAVRKNIQDIPEPLLALPRLQFEDVKYSISHRNPTMKDKPFDNQSTTVPELQPSLLLQKLKKFHSEYGTKLREPYVWETKEKEREDRIADESKQIEEQEQLEKRMKKARKLTFGRVVINVLSEILG